MFDKTDNKGDSSNGGKNGNTYPSYFGLDEEEQIGESSNKNDEKISKGSKVKKAANSKVAKTYKK